MFYISFTWQCSGTLIIVIISGINGMYLDMWPFIFVLENWSIDKRFVYFKVHCLSFNRIGQAIRFCPTSTQRFQCPLGGFSYNLRQAPRTLTLTYDSWHWPLTPSPACCQQLWSWWHKPPQQYITESIFSLHHNSLQVILLSFKCLPPPHTGLI